MYGNDFVDPTEALNASETPEFDEVGVGAEVTMYIAQLED